MLNFTEIHRQIYKKTFTLVGEINPPKVLQNETFEFSISRLGPLKEATLFIIKVINLGVIIVNLYFLSDFYIRNTLFQVFSQDNFVLACGILETYTKIYQYLYLQVAELVQSW